MEGTRIPIQHGLASPKGPRRFSSCSTAERTDHVFFQAEFEFRGYRNLHEPAGNLSWAVADSQRAFVQVFDRSAAVRGEIIVDIGVYP
jgi:hypothetical protein